MRSWWAAGSVGALALVGTGTGLLVGTRAAPVQASDPATAITLDAKLLVVAIDGSEPALLAMRTELDQIGTLYTVVLTAKAPVSAATLSDGAAHGLYDGIVRVACGAGAGPDAASVSALDDYAARFGVREACLFARSEMTTPGSAAGTSIDTSATPLSLSYTPDGEAVFGWYASPAPVQVTGVAAVLAPPADPATTPLLVDSAGHAPVAVHRFPDGRELMVLSFDQAPGAAHSVQLLAGVAGWLTHGVFIGEKRAYLTPQPDDLFIGTIMSDGTYFRMSGDELRNVAGWQSGVQATAVGATFRITFPFVGAEVSDSDDLTQAAHDVGAQFDFVSHTFDHHRLDAATYDVMTRELTNNDALMRKRSFGPYDRSSLVTPDISGLANGPVMQAALDWGIARVVCDASFSSCRGPVPNTGLPNPVVPGMFMIPRVATDLYATVSTPDEWVATYNGLNAAKLGKSLTEDEIIERESDVLVAHLLNGDIDPVMFHQSNLRAYDGKHTLMTDLLDRVLAKYAALRVLPIVSLPMDEMGARMQDRAARDSAGVAGSIQPGKSITIRATQSVRVPVTGASGANAETYGATTIMRVAVSAGQDVTLPLLTWHTAGAAAPDAGPDSGGGAAPDSGSAVSSANVAVPTSTSAPSGGCGCALTDDGDAPGTERPLLSLLFGLVVVCARSRSQRENLRR